MNDIPAGSASVNIYADMIANEHKWYYCYYDSSADPSKEGVIKTNRGISLGDSQQEVMKKYGDTAVNTVVLQSSVVYQDLLEYNPPAAGIMRSQCSTYINYAYEDLGAIQFYFDESGNLSWIVYFSNIQ